MDPADTAEVASVVLHDEGHGGQTYELTGPEAVTPRRQAEVLVGALGEDVRFVELAREQAREHMSRFMPEPVIERTLDILGGPLPEEQRDEAPRGEDPRPPVVARQFADWAARSVQAFRKPAELRPGPTESPVVGSGPSRLCGIRRPR